MNFANKLTHYGCASVAQLICVLGVCIRSEGE